MGKYAEQITAFEQKRASLVAANEEILSKAADEGSTLDAEQKETFDNNEADIKEIDDHLKRLRAMEKAAGEAAKPVNGQTQKEGTESRVPAQIKAKPKLEPGIQMARVIKCIGQAKGNLPQAEQLAIQQYANDEAVVNVLKAAVAAGTTSN